MKKNILLSTGIVALSIANSSVSYCKAEQTNSSQSSSAPMTTYEPKVALTLNPIKKGDSYIHRLESNRTTGYAWSHTCPTNDIIDITQKYEKKASLPGMMGVGGDDIFTITGKKVGTITCTFEYKRSWETDRPALSTETVTFEIVE